MATCTAKDSHTWREWRQERESAQDWHIERLPYHSTPFIWPEHWDRLKRNVSEREWRRRALAEDVASERATYFSFSRDDNVMQLPPGARDVTADVLGPVCGAGFFDCLVGHDPGELVDVSIVLKAFKLPRMSRPVWFATDEFVTSDSTSEMHAEALRDFLSDRYGVMRPLLRAGRVVPGSVDTSKPLAHMRIDPYGDSHNRTDLSVYTIFQRAGFHVRSAAYKKGKGNGLIPREARIDLVNTLFCNAAGERRLRLLAGDDNRPRTPKLLRAIMEDERDLFGKAETQKKGAADQSHFVCALGYGLYRFEKVRRADVPWKQAA